MGAFTDERGEIFDLLEEKIDCVTRIRTKQFAIRGNHVHMETTQWTYVISGHLDVHTLDGSRKLGPGDLWCDMPGEPHAWQAITDCECMVFTRGPRSGENYEADTRRVLPALIV